MTIKTNRRLSISTKGEKRGLSFHHANRRIMWQDRRNYAI